MDFLRQKLVGWEDLANDAGDLVEFNSENLEILLEMPEALSALSQALSAATYIQKGKN